MSKKEKICLDLFEIGAIKFGEVTLVSGLKSPIYLDLRFLVSYPKILKAVAGALAEIGSKLEYDRIAGIPYTALSIATTISVEKNIPMIYARKEAKDYGTKKMVEGIYKEGETILVYDDVIAVGTSKFEAVKPLEAAGLKVKDFVVLLDRSQGGKEALEEKGYKLHAFLTMPEMLDILRKNNKISEEQAKEVREYIKDAEKWSASR